MNLKTHFETYESYMPVNLSEPGSFFVAILVVFGFILARYFLLVGIFHFSFWRSIAKEQTISISHKVLHDHGLRPRQMAYEIKWSMVSSAIFAFFGVVMGLLWQQGYTQIYLEFDKFGHAYLLVSLILISLVHEIYFYFTHVWMHWPSVFKRVHFVHHYSKKTSPWASFSFHPLEAVIQAVFLPLIVLIIPVHPVMLIVYLTFMTVTAISNHLGSELIRNQTIKNLFISGTHHHAHHDRFSRNFGLYYTWPDKLFGTESREST